MGVWIETQNPMQAGQQAQVTPCMGVWIETMNEEDRGALLGVTPCMGVWIETSSIPWGIYPAVSHTLYGCVD